MCLYFLLGKPKMIKKLLKLLLVKETTNRTRTLRL